MLPVRLTSSVLGIVLGDHAIDIAEVDRGSGRPELRTAGSLQLDRPLSEANIDQTARALAARLAVIGAGTRRVVFGLPARSLISRLVQVPAAADDDALPAMLRIQAERLFTQDASELAIDYAETRVDPHQPAPGGDDTEANRPLLMVAALRRRVELLRRLAAAAKLKVIAITAAPAALSAATAMAAADEADRAAAAGHLVLCVADDSAELAVISPTGLTAIRHLAAGSAPPTGQSPETISVIDQIAAGVRRVLAVEARSLGVPDRPPVQLWDGVGLGEQGVQRLRDALRVDHVTVQRLDRLTHANGVAIAPADESRIAAAVAVAVPAIARGDYAIDLLHSRLERAPRRRLPAYWRIAALIAVVVALPVGYFGVDHLQRVGEIAQLRAQLREMSQDIQAAEHRVQLVDRAESWFTKRTPVLPAMLAITSAFPERGSIWVTDLAFDESMAGVITGSALTDQDVLALIDDLKQTGSFDGVRFRYLDQTTGRQGTFTSYAIEFRYTGRAAR